MQTNLKCWLFVTLKKTYWHHFRACFETSVEEEKFNCFCTLYFQHLTCSFKKKKKKEEKICKGFFMFDAQN